MAGRRDSSAGGRRDSAPPPAQLKLSSIGLTDLRVDGVPSLAEVISREGPLFKNMVEGQQFQILKDNGKKISGVVLRFEPSCHVLHCGRKTVIDVVQLKEVRLGFSTQTFLSFAERDNVAENCAFSIVYSVEGSNLPKIVNLAAPNEEKRDLWAHALKLLIQTLNAMNGECYSLMRPWIAALKKGSDCLGIKATVKLLNQLHISVDDARKVPKGFKFFFPDFIRLVRRLRAHPVATYLYTSYCNHEAPGMTVAQLVEFCKNEQAEQISDAEAVAIIDRYGNGTMDELAFQNFLISRDNDAWNPAREAPHHNMQRKFTEYFVNSSHNTYLSGSQLNSVSSIEMYVRALKLGCRCIEIDIWDGPNGEPIVYHGFTLTSKILFRDVLRVIRSHGFVTSPYPLILSFENHCSKPQQDKMALYLKEILADLVLPYSALSNPKAPLPSPTALMKKVLIKGSSHVSSHVELLDDLAELDDEMAVVLKGGTLTKDELTFLQDRMAARMERPVSEDANASSAKLLSELDALIFLRAKKLAKFPLGYEAFEPNNMTSFSENRINRLLAENNGIMQLRKFNSQFVTRVYPKGTRFDSSNYDPVLYWYAGCQMLALNFQTATTAPMLINYAKFRENGGRGYNLRPEYLNEIVPASGSMQFGKYAAKVERFKRPEPICSRLRVHVYGARLLPTRRATWVEVSIYDGTAREDRMFRTPVAVSAFAPDYNAELVIPVVDSANAFLVLTVQTKEDGEVGYYSVPLECVRAGYRACHLFDALYEPISKGLAHVFCKFTFEK